MSGDTQRRQLPAWALALIAMVVIVYLGIYLGGIGMIFLAKHVTQKALEPAEIVKVSKEIAQFQESLPPGFTFVYGLRVGPVKVVTLVHKPDGLEITIACEHKTEDLDAEANLKQATEAGLNLPTAGWLPTFTRFKSTKIRSEFDVAGEKMPYLVGPIGDSDKSEEGFLGCIASKKAQKSILIFGLQPEGGSYNIDETLNLLKSIQQL